MKVKTRIFGLDLMRAIAIILVVVSHSVWFFPNTNGISLTLMNFAGYIGVEIFFVLSGFLIGNILYSLFVLESFDKKKLFHFWKRRWLRTLPNYYLILIINILLSYFLFYDLPEDIWKYVFFLQNFSSEQSPFFYESWSLSIEEFAYIIGPLLLYVSMLIPSKINKSKVFLIVTLSIISFFIFTKLVFHFSHYQLNSLQWTLQLKSIVIYRIDAIYYGFLAAYLYNSYKGFWTRNKNIFFVIGMLLVVVFRVGLSLIDSDVTSQPFVWNVMYMPTISIAIAFTLPFFSEFNSQKGIIVNLVTRISILSYAIYLIHYSIVLKLFQYLVLEELNGMRLYAIFGLYLVTVLFLSSLLYRYFEKPFMDLREKSIFKT